MRPAAYRINLTAHEVRQLEQMIRKSTAPQHLVKRAKIILMANEEGKSNKEIAARVGTTLGKVTKWTRRWIEKALDPVKERLSDLRRSGSPVKIKAEQWCQIIAVCCSPPKEYGYPMSHWTGAELAKEVIKQGIVGSISVSHLNDFLKKHNYNRTVVAIG